MAVAKTQSSFFDEEDIIDKQPAKQEASAFFDEADVVQAQPAAKSSFFDEADVVTAPKEEDKGGLLVGKDITDDDIKSIAAKTGADPQFIRDMAPYYGRPLESESHPIKTAAGFASEAAGGIPTFIAKKLQSDPKNRAAMDELNDLAQAKKSYAQAGAELAAGLVIPAGAGIKGAAAAGALYGLGESREGRELQSAGIGAAGGAALGGIAHGLGKLVGKARDKATQSAIRELETSKAGRDIAERVEQAIAKDAAAIDDGTRLVLSADESLVKRTQAALQDAESAESKAAIEAADTVREFGSYVSKPGAEVGSKLKLPEAIKTIQQRVATEGEDFVRKEFQDYAKSKKAIQILGDEVETKLSETTGGFMRKVRDFLVDGRFAYRMIDDKLGLNTEKIIDDISQAQNRYTVNLAAKMEQGAKLTEAARASGIDSQALYQALDTGSSAGLSKEQQPVFEAWKAAFEQARNDANELFGSEVIKAHKGGYVPHHTVETPEFIARMNAARETIDKRLGTRLDAAELSEKQLKELAKDVEFQEYKKGLEIMEGRSLIEPEEILRASREYQNPGTMNSKMQTAASAARRREGDIPDFLLEKNPAKLWSSWNQETLKHAYFRNGLAELRTARNMALAAGDKQAASYITKHLQDLSGLRQGTMNAAVRSGLQRLEAAAKTKLKRGNLSPMGRTWNEFLAETPEFMGTLMSQVYPNFLGLSPRAAIVNLTQPFYMTVPELGNAYGISKLLNAAPNTLKSGLGWSKASRDALRKEGLLGAQWNTELRDALKGSIDKSGIYKMGSKALEKYTDVAMYMFEKSEALNRQLTTNIADSVAADLLKGTSKGAKEFLADAGSGYRRSVQKAITLGDEREVQRLTRNYLLGKTMFHYNRASMSEFGRFMGPFFSVFTKWPTSIAGDMLQIAQRKGKVSPAAMRIGAKFMMPWALVATAERLTQPEEGASAIQQRLLGKQGLAGAAPVTNILNIAQGRFGKPPAVAAVADLPAAVLDRDPEKIWKWFNQTINSFAPGAAIIRLLTDDLPTLTTGERPEGTFLGKAAKAIDPDADPDVEFRSLRDTIKGRTQ